MWTIIQSLKSIFNYHILWLIFNFIFFVYFLSNLTLFSYKSKLQYFTMKQYTNVYVTTCEINSELMICNFSTSDVRLRNKIFHQQLQVSRYCFVEHNDITMDVCFDTEHVFSMLACRTNNLDINWECFPKRSNVSPEIIYICDDSGSHRSIDVWETLGHFLMLVKQLKSSYTRTVFGRKFKYE